jgi:hypothetical protein
LNPSNSANTAADSSLSSSGSYVANELVTSPTRHVPDRRAACTASTIGSTGSGSPASCRRTEISDAAQAGIDADGGTWPRSHDSSRWVWALTSPGSTATLPSSSTPPPSCGPTLTITPRSTVTTPPATGGVLMGRIQAAL